MWTTKIHFQLRLWLLCSAAICSAFSLTNVVEIGKRRERETHTQQVSDKWTHLREPVFFPFSSDVYRGQKEQTKNKDYIHNRA